MLANGVDPEAPNQAGVTPSQMAWQWGLQTIWSYVLADHQVLQVDALGADERKELLELEDAFDEDGWQPERAEFLLEMLRLPPAFDRESPDYLMVSTQPVVQHFASLRNSRFQSARWVRVRTRLLRTPFEG